MSTYQIHRDTINFVITKDGRTVWNGNYELSLSGFGFTSKDKNGDTYHLKSKGFLFFRKLFLLKNGFEIDRIKLYKSESTGVSFQCEELIYIDNRYELTICRHREESSHGKLLFSWESLDVNLEIPIFTVLLVRLQNSGHVYAGAVP